MKKKLSIATGSVLLCIVLATLIVSIPSVKAYDTDMGCASNLYTTNWLQYDSNAENTSLAFSEIEDIFADQKAYHWYMGYWVYLGQIYGEVINWGSSTTESIITNRIDHDITWHSSCYATLYVGHGTTQGFFGYSDDPENPSNPPDLISYSTIEDHTENTPNHRFTFMWVCSGGDNFPQGSAYAWNPLYWNDPNTYIPNVWIGFDDASPWLMESMNENNIYKYWLVFFYNFALDFNGYTIMQALDYASMYSGFDDYESSVLTSYSTYWPYPPQGPSMFNGSMHIGGNLNMILPHTLAIY